MRRSRRSRSAARKILRRYEAAQRKQQRDFLKMRTELISTLIAILTEYISEPADLPREGDRR